MNTRTKSALLIIGTLIVGVLIGVLATARVTDQRIDRMRELRSRSGFEETVLQALGPISEEQTAAIKVILSESHERMGDLRREWRASLRAEGDSMRKALREVLTPQQIGALDDWMTRQQRRPRRPGEGERRRRQPPDSLSGRQ